MARRNTHSEVTKQSPILVIGFGSIGQRHYHNLLSLGYKNVSVYDVDEKKLRDAGVLTVSSPDAKTLLAFAVVFVCNPTNLHVKTARVALAAGCHIFIEKPLSHTNEGIIELKQAAKKSKRTVMVACNYRFNQGFVFMSDILQSNKLGKVLSVRVVVGHDIAGSRKGVDYRKTYAANKKLGGGVILDSGSHVFDYLTVLFGKVTHASAVYGNVGPHPMNAEDYASISARFTSRVEASVSLDYFSIPKRHLVEIQCEKGIVSWDFPTNTVEWYDPKKGSMERKVCYQGKSKDEARNDMYLRELKYFFEVIQKKKPAISDIAHGSEVVNMLLALKRAGKKINK